MIMIYDLSCRVLSKELLEYYHVLNHHLKDRDFDILLMKNSIFHFLLYRQKENRFIEKSWTIDNRP